MRKTVLTKDDPVVAGPLPLGQAIRQLPVQCVTVLSKASAATLSQELAKASWGSVLAQVLGLLSITVTLSV